ncbi:MAG: hypothetical protein ACRC9K_24005 [Afipia sp.]
MSFDPAATAMIISGAALALAGLTFYEMWRKRRAAFVAKYPNVLSTIWPVVGHPSLMRIQIKITNNFEADLEFTEVHIDSPEGSRAFSPQAPKPPAVSFGGDERIVVFHHLLSRAEAPRQGAEFRHRSTACVDCYVYSEKTPFAPELSFWAIFHLQNIDTRRAARIVIRKKIALPPRMSH